MNLRNPRKLDWQTNRGLFYSRPSQGCLLLLMSFELPPSILTAFLFLPVVHSKCPVHTKSYSWPILYLEKMNQEERGKDVSVCLPVFVVVCQSQKNESGRERERCERVFAGVCGCLSDSNRRERDATRSGETKLRLNRLGILWQNKSAMNCQQRYLLGDDVPSLFLITPCLRTLRKHSPQGGTRKRNGTETELQTERKKIVPFFRSIF